jgi:soluble lytic murein transglycosylase-like protein
MSFVAAALRALLTLLLCLSVAAPAGAQTRLPASLSLVGFYSGFVRSMNPHLALWQCDVYARELLDNAHRLHLDPALLAAIVTVESHWDPGARSWRGAEGLGQLMPVTAHELGVDPTSGRANLLGTSMYLHMLMGEFRAARQPMRYAVAGYNAGPNAVKRFGGIPPITETQHYVVKVMRVWHQVKAETRLMRYAEPEPSLQSFDAAVDAYWGAR